MQDKEHMWNLEQKRRSKIKISMKMQDFNKDLTGLINYIMDDQYGFQEIVRNYTCPKMRTMSFFTNNIDITAKASGLIEYIFHLNFDHSYMCIQAFEASRKTCKMSNKEIFDKRFLSVKDLMRVAAYLFKAFRASSYSQKYLRKVR
ncbi:hypothetical protein LTR37_017218 [Vermiconidia calcicola]|uniref:Uncharacterized protein n=1 Tax=Vermiconidia calcicola TaxID=1690605 RepID=A0ACC3MKR5_9PEZI|nr:hypothetical protein LTR37_017218 [Vermiconidia calcicola]